MKVNAQSQRDDMLVEKDQEIHFESRTGRYVHVSFGVHVAGREVSSLTGFNVFNVMFSTNMLSPRDKINLLEIRRNNSAGPCN